METTTDLLQDIRARLMLPDQAFSDSDLVRIANGEVLTFLVPLLLSTSEEYLVRGEDIRIEGPFDYEIPTDSIVNGIRGLYYSQDGVRFTPLPRIEPEVYETYGVSGTPQAYMVQGNDIILAPMATSGTLRFTYYARPREIVLGGGEFFEDLPDLPKELWPLLSQRVAAKVLQALGDPRAGAAREEADLVKEGVLGMLQPRTQGLGRVVINRYSPGWRG